MVPPGWLYDLVMRPLGWLGLTSLRARLVRGVRGRTLEVGAGTGLTLSHYDGAPSSVVALDVDQAALLRARERMPRMLAIRASVEALPFRDGAFDTVVSCLVFCSVPDPARGLSEVRRVLSPEGTFRMLEHVRPRGRLAGCLADWLTPGWRHVAGGCRLNRHTVEVASSAGLRPIESRTMLGGALVELHSRRSPPGG